MSIEYIGGFREGDSKRKIEGAVKLEEVKIYSLTYVDDIVLIAEGRAMIAGLERYLEKQKGVNVKETI